MDEAINIQTFSDISACVHMAYGILILITIVGLYAFTFSCQYYAKWDMNINSLSADILIGIFTIPYIISRPAQLIQTYSAIACIYVLINLHN